MIIKKAIFTYEIIKQTMVEFFSFRIFSVFLVESILLIWISKNTSEFHKNVIYFNTIITITINIDCR